LTRRFVPVLIETSVWEPCTWDDADVWVPDKIMELVEEEDVEGIYELIKDNIDYEKQEVLQRIKDFIVDVKYAAGIVSATDQIYQAVIKAISDLKYREEC